MNVSFDNTVSGKLRLLFDGVPRFTFNEDGTIDAEGFPESFPFTKEYVSDEFTFVNAPITFEHGMGVLPKFVRLDARCIVAEHGYLVGEVLEVPLIGTGTGGSSYNGAVVKTTTHLRLRLAVSGIAITTMNAGAWATLNSANWVYTLRAWA